MCVCPPCLSLCDPMDRSLPGSSMGGQSQSLLNGILQARILEWVAIPFSRGSSRSRDQTHISCTGRKILYHLSQQCCSPKPEQVKAIAAIPCSATTLLQGFSPAGNESLGLKACAALILQASCFSDSINLCSDQ